MSESAVDIPNSISEEKKTVQEKELPGYAVTEEDIKTLKHLLPKNNDLPERILRRCVWGYPQVVFSPQRKVSKSQKESAKVHMPGTLIWLLCPRIKELVSKLESKGSMEEIREEFGIKNEGKRKSSLQNAKTYAKMLKNNSGEAQKIETSTESTQATSSSTTTTTTTEDDMKKQHLIQSFENYKNWLKDSNLLTTEEFHRWRTYNLSDNESMPDKRFGNSAVQAPESIKCLHSHMAVHLLPNNFDYVGQASFERIVKEEIPITDSMTEEEKPPVKDIEDLHYMDCPSGCIRCKQFQ